MNSARLSITTTLLLAFATSVPAQKDSSKKACIADVAFALEELGDKCKALLKAKGIDWKKVSREFKKAAKKAKTPQQHYEILLGLTARLQDGHAKVWVLDEDLGVTWPGAANTSHPCMFWCRIGEGIFVKNAWGSAASGGIKPGMEILKVDGDPVMKWLDARTAELRSRRGFSTDHHAFFHTTHRGLAAPVGTRMKFALRTVDGKKKNRTLSLDKKTTVVPNGPAFYPPAMEHGKNVRYARLESGHGYIHIRRCKPTLPTELDPALAALADVPGMILDFRGNSGGGFDHDAVLGRFVPKGETMKFGKAIPSSGDQPYGGPVVVIVDGSAVSAGETGSGMFKEDGRAYMIGESPTAGMSAQKVDVALPSKKFTLVQVAIYSNKARYQQGRGIEGIGIEPHELVEFDPKDLAAERDTLIQRADAIFADFPQKKVPYKPAKFGWKPSDKG